MNDFDLSSLIIKDIIYLTQNDFISNETMSICNKSSARLIIIKNGSIYYEYSGQRYFSDSKIVLLIPQGINYTLTGLEKTAIFVLDFICIQQVQFNNIISVDIENNKNILALITKLHNIWDLKDNSYKLKCLAILYEILAKLNDLKMMSYCPDYKYNKILPSINYLETYFTNPELTNDILAEQSNISTVYFRKIFTEKYGISPMKYVQLKRIERALELLKNQHLSISNIAEMVGFNSVYHFSRSFKKTTGYTPSEFIRINKA